MANRVARHLRRNQTIAEAHHWKELKELRQQGFHFRRQVPIDQFIVDFACFSQRLVVEIDGVQHATPTGRKADAQRDAHLSWRGFTVLRFTNADVMGATEGVILEILEKLGAIQRPV
jgi:very-short-patch-repair endonuclease